MNPPDFITTKLFSAKAKFRLLAEPFIGKSEDGYYQSVSQFVRRRLGQEFLDYAINPFVAGVFAGDPDELSVKSAFPKLYRLEEVYGGLIKGMIKGAKERKQREEESKQVARMFSFKNGMQTFPKAIAEKLKTQINYVCRVKSVERSENLWKVLIDQKGEQKELLADVILSTIPAYSAGRVFSCIDNHLPEHTDKIYYPPVMVLYLGYKKENIGQPLDGFGYLIPQIEKKSYLGAIWSSVIFPGRTDEDNACFTIFIGGARSPELFDMKKENLIKKVLDEFHSTMKINSDPVFTTDMMWEKAIPQYNTGYIEHEKYFEQFEEENPGIFLSGNYRGGISVGDCVKNSEVVFKKIVKIIKNL
jgi:oxygen-dependent protoporphyrinogen oxidase